MHPTQASRTTGVRRRIEHAARETGAGHLSVEPSGLDETQDSQDEAQDGQDEAHDDQDETQDSQDRNACTETQDSQDRNACPHTPWMGYAPAVPRHIPIL